MNVAMNVAERLDDYGRAGWITVMILGFVICWPVGLAILAFMLWSGRMGNGPMRGRGRWHFEGSRRERRDRWFAGCTRSSSGNVAFDEYREETLKRLEDEQQEFKDFLHRLRHAKDKAEFDEFMAERRRRPPEEPPPNGPALQPEG